MNHVNGNNLIECDQAVLKEMGIKKIGDRVRIFVGIKNLRNKAVPNQKKRNRDSMALLDSRAVYTPSSSGSPRNLTHGRDRSMGSSAINRRWSRIEPSPIGDSHFGASSNGRPGSPLADPDSRSRTQRYGNMSPMESARKEQQTGYFSNPSSAKNSSGRRPETPVNSSYAKNGSNHANKLDTVGGLTANLPVVRVIFNGGQTKVVDIKDCRSGDQIILATLRKLGLPEDRVKNYCFYTTDEFCVEPDLCRRVTESELTRICSDLSRPERGRLILRKIHAGEPTIEEIEKARAINHEEINETHKAAMSANNSRNIQKMQKLTGESLSAMQYPLSPVTFEAPKRFAPAGASSRALPSVSEVTIPKRSDSRRTKPMKQFLGQRPPSELITQELTTYFPEHQKAEIERAVTLSQRRSARLSKAMSRLSIASNISFASSLKDAPPLPSIADQWLTGNNQPPRTQRPLSVSRFPGSYRDSIISTSLQPLQEESPTEPNRKSYVSFDSASDSANVTLTDPEGNSSQYYDDGSATIATTDSGSMNEQYRQVIAEDGEGPDPELEEFLQGDSWEDTKWMKGSLIGQGSFGSVFLALHAITGELMAVKQVEMPSKTNQELDKRKETMVAALKREIDLLRDLQHPHNVQYLGASCKN